MVSKKNIKNFLFIGLAIVICGVIIYYFFYVFLGTVKYSRIKSVTSNSTSTPVPVNTDTGVNSLSEVPNTVTSQSEIQIPVTHIKTPDVVKAVYLSSWSAGYKNYFDPVVNLIDNSELNSVVIDIKDSSGRIGFKVSDPQLLALGSSQNRIPNIRALTNELHKKNIYIIGRIAVFQDPFMAEKRPDWAIVRKSDGSVWKDSKGLSFLDPANKEVWDYIVSIARDAYAEGFDEINFDYIRYPSDGNIQDIDYKIAPGKTRADNIESFFKYLSQEVKKDNNIPMSADLFGMTTEVNDDMGIGQVWEKALPYFDFLSPMVYPSHYISGYDGFSNPANHPYEVIYKALLSAIKKTKSVTPEQSIKKIRPWLQDFNLGAVYTPPMIQSEIKAVYDNNLTSWMLWDSSNKYTAATKLLEVKQ